MSAEALTWHDEHLLDHRRRLRTSLCVSLAVHGLIFALFAASPPQPVPPAPAYLAVDLVAAPPAAGPSGRSTPKPAGAPKPSKPPPPAAQPAPPPPPAPPAPPVAKAPVQVLPEETPGRIRKAKPEPEEVAKVEPKPVPRPTTRPRRRAKEEQLSLGDAMAALNEELGADETAELLRPQNSGGEVATSDGANASDSSDSSGSTARPGLTVTPEQAAWDRAVTRKIREYFPNISTNRGRGLVVRIEVVVSASGDLAGEPRLLATSGDLDFDRMALAAVSAAAPLPQPPEPGARQLSLTSEER